MRMQIICVAALAASIHFSGGAEAGEYDCDGCTPPSDERSRAQIEQENLLKFESPASAFQVCSQHCEDRFESCSGTLDNSCVRTRDFCLDGCSDRILGGAGGPSR